MRKINSQQGLSQPQRRTVRARRVDSSSVYNEFDAPMQRNKSGSQSSYPVDLYNQYSNINKPQFKFSNADELPQRRHNEKFSVPVNRYDQGYSTSRTNRFQDHKFSDIYSNSMRGDNRRILHSEIYEQDEPYEDAKSVGQSSYKSTQYINGLLVKIRQRSTSTTKSRIIGGLHDSRQYYGYEHHTQPQPVQNEYNLEQKQKQSQPKKQEYLFGSSHEQDKPSNQVPGFQFSFGYGQKKLKKEYLDQMSQNEEQQQFQQEEQPKYQDAHQWSSYKDHQRDPSRELFKEHQQQRDSDEDDFQTINLGYGKYEGQIYDNAMNGQGILYDQDGDVIYQGGFKDGEFDGYGILVNNDQHNEQESPNYRDLSDSQNCWKKYEGMFKESEKNGVGYLHFNNGDVFIGEFKNDQANGLGVYTSSDHKVFGVWERDHYRKGLS